MALPNAAPSAVSRIPVPQARTLASASANVVPRAYAAPLAPLLEVEFTPQDRSVHHVRVMVHSFVLLLGHEHAFAGRVTVTCAELVDTVARHFFDRSCRLRLRLDPVNRSVRVELSGEATLAKGRALGETVEVVNRGAPAESYTAALSAMAAGNDFNLGLARIRYEGQMRLDCHRRGALHTVVAESVD